MERVVRVCIFSFHQKKKKKYSPAVNPAYSWNIEEKDEAGSKNIEMILI